MTLRRALVRDTRKTASSTAENSHLLTVTSLNRKYYIKFNNPSTIQVATKNTSGKLKSKIV